MTEGPDLARFDWSLFPCYAGTGTDQDKRARVAWKTFQERRPTPAELAEWRTRYPGSNWAIATGRVSGIIVLDIDTEEGERYATARGLPPTPEVRTARGRHLYFRWPGFACRNKVKENWTIPGCDFRGDGGYIIAPGSVHPSGVRYTWREGLAVDDLPIADPPDWLLGALKAASTPPVGAMTLHERHRGRSLAPYGAAALDNATRAVAGAPEGARNDTLNREAHGIGRLVGGGVLEEATARAELLEAALLAGLPRAEADATIASGIAAGRAKPFVPEDRPPTVARSLTLTQPSPRNGHAPHDAPEPTGGEQFPGENAPSAPPVFRPDWSNEPPFIPPILTLDGVRIGSPGNVTCLVAQPGVGKSAVCEAIIAARFTDGGDTLGFQAETLGAAVYIDTERSKADHWHSWARTMRRAGIDPGEPIPEGLDFMLYRTIPTAGERRAALGGLLEEEGATLLILDGVADFVRDVNDSEECGAFVQWLLAIAADRELCVVATIHDNPQLANEKPRGHLGSELMRRAESLLKITRDNATGGRLLTTNFSHGKIRNDRDKVEVAFAWDEDAAMFLMTEKPVARAAGRSRADLREIVRAATQNGTRALTYTELVREIARVTGTSETNARTRLFTRLKQAGLIIKLPDGYWRYDPSLDD